jgi:hypothetical protein
MANDSKMPPGPLSGRPLWALYLTVEQDASGYRVTSDYRAVTISADKTIERDGRGLITRMTEGQAGLVLDGSGRPVRADALPNFAAFVGEEQYGVRWRAEGAADGGVLLFPEAAA